MIRLPNFIRKLFSKPKIYSDSEIEGYAKELIMCAELDLISAKILNSQRDKKYAPIIYHLQQGIEKLTKSELLLRKTITMDELKRINHRSPEAFMLSLNRVLEDKEIGSFILSKIPKEALDEARKLIKKPNKIINSSEQELRLILAYYNLFKKSAIPQTLYSEAKLTIPEEKLRNFSQKRANIFMNLYFLSWITFPHAELTRYPNNQINPWEYDKSRGIVRVIPLMLKKSLSLLNQMKKYDFEVKQNG